MADWQEVVRDLSNSATDLEWLLTQISKVRSYPKLFFFKFDWTIISMTCDFKFLSRVNTLTRDID